MQTEVISKRFQEIPYNVLAGTADESPAFRFNVLKSRFDELSSIREFLTSSDYLGGVTVDIVVPAMSVPAAIDWQRGIRQALADVATYVMRADKQYEGTKTFHSLPIRNVLRDKTMRLSKKLVNGLGTSNGPL